MSPRLNDYPFLQQNFVQHHNRHKRTASSEHTLSDTSTNMCSKAQITPPTPYLGDDELTGDLESSKPSTCDEPSTGTVSDIPNAVVTAYDTKDSPNIKDDHSLVDTVKDGCAVADSSDDEGADAKGEDTNVKIDLVCSGEADGPCTLGSGDYRKVVSHVFGRNKRCTHQIPEDCWIKYCRKHYQRQKYRCPADWFETQLLLIDAQIGKMEEWGGITSWTIAIRKKERELLDNENAYYAQHGRLPDGPRCRERFLVSYLGSNKTFENIRHLVNVINLECEETKNRRLPSFEFLPVIDERRNPRPKRGAARRASRAVASVAPSTFRLSTDTNGRIVKVEAPAAIKIEASTSTPSRTSSATPSSVLHSRTSQLSKTESDQSRAVKRSASIFDEDEGKSEVAHARLVKRQAVALGQQEEKHDIGHAPTIKRQASAIAEKEAKPINVHARPAKRHASAFTKKEEKPEAGHAGPFKRESIPNKDEKKANIDHERPTKFHRRSHSF